MHARPSAADALSPEQRGGPNRQNRPENAEPREGVEHKQQGIPRVVEDPGMSAGTVEKNSGRNDDERNDEQDQPHGEIFAPISAVLAPSLFAPETPQCSDRPSRQGQENDHRAYDKRWRDPPHIEKPGNALHTTGRHGPIRLGADVVYEGNARAFRRLVEIPFNALQHPATTKRPDCRKRSYIAGAVDLDDTLRHQIAKSRESRLRAPARMVDAGHARIAGQGGSAR